MMEKESRKPATNNNNVLIMAKLIRIFYIKQEAAAQIIIYII